MDAMIATITAISMIAVISGLISAANVSNLNEQQLAATGHDLLSVMHINGTLNRYIGMPVAQVNASLEQELQLMPASYCGNITVKIYSSTDFSTPTYTYAAKGACSTGSNIMRIKRIFADYNSGQFGVADMTLWLKV